MHHDWDKNQKVRENVAVPFPCYVHDGCNFKLIMQTFIYKIIPDKERRGFEANFYVIWSTIQVDKNKLNLIKRPKDETRKKVLSAFLELSGPVLVASSNTGSFATVRVITMNVFQSHHNLQ